MSRRTPITRRPSIVLGSSSGGGVLTRFSACPVSERDLLVAVPTGWGGFVFGWLFWALSEVGVCALAWGVCAIPCVAVLEYDGAATGADAEVALLTPREREILQLVAEGKSNKEVANLLHLSVYTVETHRANIMEKLKLKSVPELILYAVRKGIVQLR